MDVFILDQNLRVISIIDSYLSFIWTDRFGSCGDFELYLTPDNPFVDTLVKDNYVKILDSDRLMVIETIEITTDVEEGPKLKVTGRSIESLIDRRIVWNEVEFEGGLQALILRLFNENIISPSNSNRKIPRVKFISSSDTRVTSLTVEKSSYHGENILDLVTNYAEQNNVGFRMIPNGEDFEFEFYFGTDRSCEQSIIEPVIFSPRFENIVRSDYLESDYGFKNVVLAYKKINFSTYAPGYSPSESMKPYYDQWNRKYTIPVFRGETETAGLKRREIFCEAQDLIENYTQIPISDDETQSFLDETDYQKQIKAKGEELLAETKAIETFEGEIDTTSQWIYNRDFYIGDLVEIIDAYGHKGVVRVDEVVRSYDENGYVITPSFVTVKD